MSMTEQPSNGQLAGNVLFYSRPEPLSSDMHGKLGLRRIDRPFAFAAGAQAVPLTVTEFGVAALSYPIIFAGDRHQPLAVMGVSGEANMFQCPGGADVPRSSDQKGVVSVSYSLRSPPSRAPTLFT